MWLPTVEKRENTFFTFRFSRNAKIQGNDTAKSVCSCYGGARHQIQRTQYEHIMGPLNLPKENIEKFECSVTGRTQRSRSKVNLKDLQGLFSPKTAADFHAPTQDVGGTPGPSFCTPAALHTESTPRGDIGVISLLHQLVQHLFLTQWLLCPLRNKLNRE